VTLKLLSKENKTNDIKTFTFNAHENFTWEAGQYLIYSLPHENQDLRGKMRFFSISSSPFERNPKITTRIDNTKGSTFKKTLNSLKIGDTIEAKGPDGDFVYKEKGKKHIFIAGGIGITPFISIIRQLNYEGKKINVTLFFANRDNNIPFKEELEEIASNHKELKIIYFVSPERIDKDSIQKEIPKKDYLFYISGPDPMVDAIDLLLKELKVNKENIIYDYFSGYKKV
jgi:ferredoxin-NADP reductase